MDLENRYLLKRCRVCNKEGSKNIFFPSTSTISPNSVSCSSSNIINIDRLLEKLRFVTMIKIDESDNKPKLLCDLCIIQLNVAYQFKTLAIEMDVKHQQYLIESGVSASTNRDNSQITEQASSLRPLLCTTSNNTVYNRRIIKSEPSDYEIMSDITVDTNTDNIDEYQTNGANSNQQFDSSSMVCLNDVNLLNRANADSDVEFINNCLPSFCRFEQQNQRGVTTTTTTTTTKISSKLVIATSKPLTNITTISPTSSERSKTTDSTISTSGTVKRAKWKRLYSFDNARRKSLRTNKKENVDYSLVKKRSARRKRVINPINKTRKIKVENGLNKDTLKKRRKLKTVQSAGKKLNKSIEKPVNKREEQSNEIDKLRKSLKNNASGGNVINRRRVTIAETDRFKFAAIKTVNSVTTKKS